MFFNWGVARAGSARENAKFKGFSHLHFDLLGKSCRCKCSELSVLRGENASLTGFSDSLLVI